MSPRPLRSLALALALTAALVVRADERDPGGTWALAGAGAPWLRCARDGAGLTLERAAAPGAAATDAGATGAGAGPGAPAPLRGRGALAGGWLEARFEASPGIAAGAADPAALALALEGPGAGFGLWELVVDDAGPRLRGFYTEPGGRRRFELGVRPGAAPPTERGGFVRHLREAIALNQARRSVYEARTDGASAALSRRLVLLERLSIPWAWWIDLRARRWNKRGVMIVAGDFVSMQHARDAATPPARSGQATEEQLERVARRLKAFRQDVAAAADAGRFDEAARLARALLTELDAWEAAWGCHLAMTRHVVEQVGFAALNALTWRAESGGGTDGLARSFLRGLRWGLTSSVAIDRRAQASHARGAGIIVNDVPDVPLAVSYDEWVARR